MDLSHGTLGLFYFFCFFLEFLGGSQSEPFIWMTFRKKYISARSFFSYIYLMFLLYYWAGWSHPTVGPSRLPVHGDCCMLYRIRYVETLGLINQIKNVIFKLLNYVVKVKLLIGLLICWNSYELLYPLRVEGVYLDKPAKKKLRKKSKLHSSLHANFIICLLLVFNSFLFFDCL